jgi:hypothetical protein
LKVASELSIASAISFSTPVVLMQWHCARRCAELHLWLVLGLTGHATRASWMGSLRYDLPVELARRWRRSLMPQLLNSTWQFVRDTIRVETSEGDRFDRRKRRKFPASRRQSRNRCLRRRLLADLRRTSANRLRGELLQYGRSDTWPNGGAWYVLDLSPLRFVLLTPELHNRVKEWQRHFGDIFAQAAQLATALRAGIVSGHMHLDFTGQMIGQTTARSALRPWLRWRSAGSAHVLSPCRLELFQPQLQLLDLLPRLLRRGRCVRDAGVCARKLQGDPACSAEAVLHEVRCDS